jgi:adenosine deaminase
MPKAELHLHLEGAIPFDALWELVQRHGGSPEVDGPEALRRRFAYTDFAHFIDTWVWKLRFHTTYRDYEDMAEAVARDLVRQSIRYAEVFVSPTDVRHHGLETGPLLLAVRRGLDRVSGVTVALVPDLVRDTGPERAAITLEEIVDVMDEAGVIGITIGGSEQLHPPGPFAPVYRRAGEAGLRLTAHAGEAAGPESVRSALHDLGVERIGHGVRAAEDPDLLAEIVARKVPLEVCPTSNVRTGVASWEHHPVRTLIDAGAVVTINTDDPVMFGCDLAGEYQALMSRLGYGWGEVVRLARATIEASWADRPLVAGLLTELEAWRTRHLPGLS